MPLSEQQANYIIDVNLHVIILFSFLSIFFFKYISVLTSDEIDRTTASLIKKNVSKSFDNALEEINNLLQAGGSEPITPTENDWQQIIDVGEKISADATGKDPEVDKINKELVQRSIIIIIILVVFLIIMILYSYLNKIPIHFGMITINNIILFMFIAIIEYGFFTYIAKNYRASAPDDMTNTFYNELQVKIDSSLT